jgi:hypothetical protein
MNAALDGYRCCQRYGSKPRVPAMSLSGFDWLTRNGDGGSARLLIEASLDDRSR